MVHGTFRYRHSVTLARLHSPACFLSRYTTEQYLVAWTDYVDHLGLAIPVRIWMVSLSAGPIQLTSTVGYMRSLYVRERLRNPATSGSFLRGSSVEDVCGIELLRKLLIDCIVHDTLHTSSLIHILLPGLLPAFLP